ncbi:hypothetical protein [Methylobacterium isbiliense]|uniref:Uncharacterized protein n=1 Tax=Methylobacterium isbiliense TaxID=315478 RepID=A0ABQ4S7V8_9HYPH|nr:hypothetical protein [Methylobacterium isbiliense]MDN3626623.1 hypothetical protein [Methylobacterium isbiliense]GJD99275.1 hypothetical protein GMJLKIPL_1191 [Methylobacterium isbiliense]
MATEPDTHCHYMRRLHEILADRPLAAIPALADALLDRLVAFEAEAKAAGASATTLDAISNARFTAGVASLRPWLPLPRGH